MMEKPADLFLGLLDFFGVVLPGMAAVALLYPHLPQEAQATLALNAGDDASALAWIVFLLGSYALGHFVFGVGSVLDKLYDRIRKKRLGDDVPYKAARDLRARLTPNLVGNGLSLLKWARTYVGIHSGSVRLEIDRYEATSKFFRSMVVVAAVAIFHFSVISPRLGVVLAITVGGVLSFWRFYDQRWKMSEIAYAAAVLIASSAGARNGEAPAEVDDG